jgi:diaminopimelate epimerase
MTIVFNKYQGTGNDFIIIDNRNGIIDTDNSVLINKLCDRRFGIGADGLILISGSNQYDFEMKYFNSDGFESTMCGNGGRCSSDFAIRSGIARKQLTFKAIDGVHKAISEDGIIRLQMNDVKEPRIIKDNYFVNTGSPHYIIFQKDIDKLDVNAEGKKIRWSEDFAPGGTNVNFVEITASAIASVLSGQFDIIPVKVKTKGGNLEVSFKIDGNVIDDIWLSGPATYMFEGMIEV